MLCGMFTFTWAYYTAGGEGGRAGANGKGRAGLLRRASEGCKRKGSRREEGGDRAEEQEGGHGEQWQHYKIKNYANTLPPKIYIGTPIAAARDINARLLADPTTDAGYAEDLFENLVFRYEEPNGMTRWDSPLFTVPYKDEAPPFEAIWEAMVGSDGKGKVVRPNTATVLVCASFSICFLGVLVATRLLWGVEGEDRFHGD